MIGKAMNGPKNITGDLEAIEMICLTTFSTSWKVFKSFTRSWKVLQRFKRFTRSWKAL